MEQISMFVQCGPLIVLLFWGFEMGMVLHDMRTDQVIRKQRTWHRIPIGIASLGWLYVFATDGGILTYQWILSVFLIAGCIPALTSFGEKAMGSKHWPSLVLISGLISLTALSIYFSQGAPL